MPGYVTLSAVPTPMLAVACDRCGRAGRYRVAGLIERHGPDFPLPALLRVVAAGCPRLVAGEVYDPCGVRFEGLGG